MIEDVTLNVELDCDVKHPVGSSLAIEHEYQCTLEFEIEDDEALEAFAEMTDRPVVRVDAPSLDWDGKPFIPVDPE